MIFFIETFNHIVYKIRYIALVSLYDFVEIRTQVKTKDQIPLPVLFYNF